MLKLVKQGIILPNLGTDLEFALFRKDGEIMITLENPKFQINDDLTDLIWLNETSERRFYVYGEIPNIQEYRMEHGFDLTALITTDIARIILNINRQDDLAEAESDSDSEEKFERKPIWLYIDCIGGDIDTGITLATIIRLSKTPIYTVNLGLCFSMAFVLFISGHRRLSFPDAKFMFHDGYKGTMGSATKVDEFMDFNRRYEKAVIKRIILERSNETFTDQLYEKLYPHDNYFFATEALDYGFVDEIVTDLSVLG